MSSRILGLFRLTKGDLCATIYYCILARLVAKERRNGREEKSDQSLEPQSGIGPPYFLPLIFLPPILTRLEPIL